MLHTTTVPLQDHYRTTTGPLQYHYSTTDSVGTGLVGRQQIGDRKVAKLPKALFYPRVNRTLVWHEHEPERRQTDSLEHEISPSDYMQQQSTQFDLRLLLVILYRKVVPSRSGWMEVEWR